MSVLSNQFRANAGGPLLIFGMVDCLHQSVDQTIKIPIQKCFVVNVHVRVFIIVFTEMACMMECLSPTCLNRRQVGRPPKTCSNI